jgi:flagellin-like protein
MLSIPVIESKQSRAVSPVIGVILMVAITVILAAVIGAFVLEIGDQQETAPSTSFDTEQKEEFHINARPWSMANLTTVEISHAGGNNVGISNVQVKVEGNASVYGSDVQNDEFRPRHYPVPDFRETLGTNKVTEFSSGETWRVHSYSNGPNYDGLSHENYIYALENSGEPFCPTMHYQGNNPEAANFNGDSCSDIWSSGRTLEPLKQGDGINVVWEASSGGKTQTLFKYTVQ